MKIANIVLDIVTHHHECCVFVCKDALVIQAENLKEKKISILYKVKFWQSYCCKILIDFVDEY